ncbi:hypothetical protein NX059_001048 [Plenodomus lindquistii]|nr:hypothetical protein NX059_001048 [Plenodomus lindquistii]
MPSQARITLKKASDKTKKAMKEASWQVSKCILLTVCAPCICGVMLLVAPGIRKRRRRRDASRYHGPIRPLLPAPRRRALSIPSSNFQDDQRLLDQPQSTFLTELPLEIRRMIYEHALGNRSIHISYVEGQLLTEGCETPHKCQSNDTEYHTQKFIGIALPLLKTCRLIYSEAIEYLYTSNTLLIGSKQDQYPTVDMLPYFMLPHRITQIRTLYLEWTLDCWPYNFFCSEPLVPDADDGPWMVSWRAIQRLTGLRHLQVRLVAPWERFYSSEYHDRWREIGPELLQSIPKIEARKFVITLPRVAGTMDVSMKSLQCKVRTH